jgi:hypothetical protein
MKIGIFCSNNRNINWGPGKVIYNLLLGLELKNIKYSFNEVCEFNHGAISEIDFSILPLNTPIGPNVFSIPEEQKDVITKFKNFIFNSEWARNLNSKYKIFDDKNKYIWSSGIETDKYVDVDKNIEYDCLIHFKNRSNNELNIVKEMLNKYKQSFILLNHSNYNPEDIIKYSSKCKYCIILDNTETQGFANMEIMSCNLPCFVFDKNDWLDSRKFNKNVWPNGFNFATTVPYFNGDCGIKTNFKVDYNNDFEKFINNLEKYNPREYILQNHTIEKSTNKFLEIMEICHANK